ncbi:clan AA aspartic protease [Phyllobacterium sp. 628]|uniref:retropepsin-like aspartic protease family protein n=1 Tax=Phyllobacterium sp. 628 TaxID=2718938 RepID=UPI0016624E15|nr:retropepsin-like aspartic protease [Phyllobacterium sp. 628]QND51447.1 clan AA aspartic protease [Phyllobacterium sp. 628]
MQIVKHIRWAVIASLVLCWTSYGALARPSIGKIPGSPASTHEMPKADENKNVPSVPPVAARAEEVFARDGTDVIEVQASINGVEGTFIIDTGASYISVKQSFADRAQLKIIDGLPITLTTANGVIDAYLVQVDEVRLRSLKGQNIQVAIQGNGDDGFDELIDGVIGMNFLSNFDITMDEKSLRLTSRPAE